jgi:creatinine amidohydrolase
MGALQYTSHELSDRVPKEVQVYTIHYWHLLEREFDHAGEVETSLVLAIAPELVNMKYAEPNAKRLSKSKVAYGAMTNLPGSFPRITGNGVWGDPRKASEAKGREWLELVVTKLAKTMSELN